MSHRAPALTVPASETARPDAERSASGRNAPWRQIARYLAARVWQALVVIFGAVVISFLLTTLSGNSASIQAGPFATPARVKQVAHEFGYDRPVLERFGRYIVHVAHGDFGRSYRLGGSAMGSVLHALPYTLLLVGAVLVVALAVAVPLALVTLLRRGSLWDRGVRRVALLGLGVPEFWLAIILVLIFSVQLHWFQPIGYSGARSLVLPTAALALPLIPAIVRLLQGQLLDVMGADFIVAQRAKALPPRAIVLRHALRNAMPEFVTYMALQVGWLIAGTVIVESVFQWPGIGSTMFSAVSTRDLAVVQAVVVVVAVVYVALNLAADLIVLWLDPRIRLGRL